MSESKKGGIVRVVYVYNIAVVMHIMLGSQYESEGSNQFSGQHIFQGKMSYPR